MYARSLSGRRRSTPPPGYNGTAFGTGSGAGISVLSAPDDGDLMESKRHTPEEYRADRPVIFPPAGNPAPPSFRPEEETDRPLGRSVEGRLPETLTDFLSGLEGKIGAEEVILLLVMLLLSADGAGIETLLLGVVLLAGRGD